jgi:hypothetical protein
VHFVARLLGKLAGRLAGYVELNLSENEGQRALDIKTKREIWFLALGTIIAEVPVVAIVVIMILTR